MKASQAALVAAVSLAVYGKLSYKNARLVALVKRVMTYVLSCVVPKGIPPQLLIGSGTAKQIGDLMIKYKCKKPLVVTDRVLVENKIVDPVKASLDAAGMQHTTYDGVLPDPGINVIEEAFVQYKSEGCDSVIAVGGGSVIDTAKVVGAKAISPKSSVQSMKGALLVSYCVWSLPPLIAVPTTAGTGSERTVGAVISEDSSKFQIIDPALMPKAAVMDPNLLIKLPKSATAATGMDALTHAIEAHLGCLRTPKISSLSFQAVELIFKNLVRSYNNGDDLEARENMLKAAHYGGAAITEGNVGYVHAIAHQLGNLYHVPHGLANAMCLPYVLEFYLRDEGDGSQKCQCTDLFCDLAKAAGLSAEIPTELQARKALAKQFINSIFEMRAAMNMQTEVKEMKAADVPVIVRKAMNENDGCSQSLLNPINFFMELGYQPPAYMTYEDAEQIVMKLLPKTASA